MMPMMPLQALNAACVLVANSCPSGTTYYVYVRASTAQKDKVPPLAQLPRADRRFFHPM